VGPTVGLDTVVSPLEKRLLSEDTGYIIIIIVIILQRTGYSRPVPVQNFNLRNL
jgi:hypothetical protein